MSYRADTPWRITRQAQKLLGVVVDGVWGSGTQAAFDGASDDVRRQITKLLEAENLSVYSIGRVTTQVAEPKDPRVAPRPLGANAPAVKPAPAAREGRKRWYTLAELEPSLRSATSGLAHATYDRMVRKLKLEAAQRTTNGVTEYDSNSKNGSYRGLFQMGSAAWADVQRLLGRSYDEVYDPAVNARAAALYIEFNVRAARRLGYNGPITDNVVYAMHNQGAAGFVASVGGRGVQGDQSRAARGVIASALQDARSQEG